MNIGSVTNSIMNINTSNKMSDIDIAMLNKGIDNMETMGKGIVNMIDSASMERSVNPNIGGNIDLLV